MKVTIEATDDSVSVAVASPTSGAGGVCFTFSVPGMLSGADLANVLEACGVDVEYFYEDPEEKKPDYDGPSVPGFEGGFAENH
jgi:hypothetical protein